MTSVTNRVRELDEKINAYLLHRIKRVDISMAMATMDTRHHHHHHPKDMGICMEIHNATETG